MIPKGSTLCKHHGDKPKGTCPGCLRVRINQLENKVKLLETKLGKCRNER